MIALVEAAILAASILLGAANDNSEEPRPPTLTVQGVVYLIHGTLGTYSEEG